ADVVQGDGEAEVSQAAQTTLQVLHPSQRTPLRRLEDRPPGVGRQRRRGGVELRIVELRRVQVHEDARLARRARHAPRHELTDAPPELPGPLQATRGGEEQRRTLEPRLPGA